MTSNHHADDGRTSGPTDAPSAPGAEVHPGFRSEEAERAFRDYADMRADFFLPNDAALQRAFSDIVVRQRAAIRPPGNSEELHVSADWFALSAVEVIISQGIYTAALLQGADLPELVKLRKISADADDRHFEARKIYRSLLA